MRARGALVAILFAGVALPFNTPFALLALVPLYLARSRTMTIAGTVGVGVAMAVHDLIWATDEPFGAYAASLALCVMAGALGMYSGVRRAAAARERELLAEAAAAEERLRIARELHDAVGHDVSLMVVQAQALGATDERMREQTDAIADLGRRTMAELHRTLRVLRGDADAERAPGAGLADLDELVDGARASGLPITVVGRGRAARAGAAGRPVRVPDRAGGGHQRRQARRPRADDDHARLRRPRARADDRRRGRGQHRSNHRGHGLVGMRERAELFGGTLDAGPRDGQGFEVRAVLPYR